MDADRDLPVARVLAAVEETMAAGTARLRQVFTSADHEPMEVPGEVDFANRRARGQMPIAAGPGSGAGQGATTSVAMILDGADMYVEALDRPGRWIAERMSDEALAGATGDPTLLLDWLRGTTHAQETGQDTLDGDPVTVIELTVDVDRAVERAPDGVRQTLRTIMDALVGDSRPQPTTIGIDESERLRHIDIPLPNNTSGAWKQMEVTLFDLGADLHIDLPDPAMILTDAETQQLVADLTAELGDDQPRPPSEWDDPNAPGTR